MTAEMLVLLIPISLGVLMLRATIRGKVVRSFAEPRCRRCGYIVRGLPGHICPECGSDLRRIGIIRRGARVPLPRPLRLAGWSAFVFLAVFVPASVCWSSIEDYLPLVHEEHYSQGFSPGSGAYRDLEFVYDTRNYGHEVAPPTVVTIRLTLLSGGTRQMDVTGTKLGYQYFDANGRSHTAAEGLTPEVVADWMGDVGIKHSAAVQRESEIACQTLSAIFAQHAGSYVLSAHWPEVNGAHGGGGGSSYSPRWSTWIPTEFSALGWGIGLLPILRRPAGVPLS